ncbi:SCF ubiquitin ligase complex subunit [Dissophora globulifera]|uniref:SCF ubiquitin ligase complex subunit n=1 Tax=Dissophora globulifera TaxID=979702 RepID=A0A9P6RF06_9FUNG|nr:SCF ubiquitin ligase complex subunit [Dissophora globulifera]
MTCSASYKKLAVAGSSDSFWTSASSSCSSLSSDSNPKDFDKVMGDDTDLLDACPPNSRDEPQLLISTSTTPPPLSAMISDTIPATTSYCNLPSELIVLIFKFLTAPNDLRSAILACKTWCSCGVSLLWSKPSLLTVSAADRMVRTIAIPNTIFPYADYIRRLNLSFLAVDVTDDMLAQFATCSRLERLLLAGSIQISDVALKQILVRCSGLYSLDLSEIPSVTDSLLESVAAQCPRLHTLYLGSCPAITDDSVVKLARSCPQLKRLKLSHCELLTDRSILALMEHCQQLVEMDITNCSLVSSDAIHSVFDSLPQIRDINLTLLANLTDAAFSSILPTTHRFEQLRVLNLTSCALITDDSLARIIPAAPRLRSLALTKCDKISDESAGAIKTLGKHLHYLHLGHCAKITDHFIVTLVQHCTRIRYLDLACCSKLTDKAVFALAQLPKLRRIGLVKCSNITDHAIYAILVSPTLPQTLERVHLSYCVDLTEQAVAALVSQCSKLTHLSVTGVPKLISPEYQKFCRAPPAEFTAHQRDVFCVFSGKGVRELRNYMQEHPKTAISAADMGNIRTAYRRIALAVASMVAEAEMEIGEQSSAPMSSPAMTTMPPILAQSNGNLLSTSAGIIQLSDITIATANSNLATLATAATAGTTQEMEEDVEQVEQDSEDMEDIVFESGSSSISLSTVEMAAIHAFTNPENRSDELDEEDLELDAIIVGRLDDLIGVPSSGTSTR